VVPRSTALSVVVLRKKNQQGWQYLRKLQSRALRGSLCYTTAVHSYVRDILHYDVSSLCKPVSQSCTKTCCFSSVVVGSVVDIGVKCVVRKILLVQDLTAVFIVDVPTDRGLVPKVLKLESVLSDQTAAEHVVRTAIGCDTLFIPTTAIFNGLSYRAVIMDYVGKPITRFSGDLFDIFEGCVIELRKMHEAGFVHQDIKPDNILYDAIERKVHLIDFGFATRAFPGKSVPAVGDTAVFCSPYVFIGEMTRSQPISYRMMDDYISLVYTFLDFYVPYFRQDVLLPSLEKADAVVKAANPFKKFTSNNPYELAVRAAYDIADPSCDVMKLAIQFLKASFLDYSKDIRPHIPDWLHDFIDILEIDEVFSIDLPKIRQQLHESRTVPTGELGRVYPTLFNSWHGRLTKNEP
jgi:hypothetical protein